MLSREKWMHASDPSSLGFFSHSNNCDWEGDLVPANTREGSTPERASRSNYQPHKAFGNGIKCGSCSQGNVFWIISVSLSLTHSHFFFLGVYLSLTHTLALTLALSLTFTLALTISDTVTTHYLAFMSHSHYCEIKDSQEKSDLGWKARQTVFSGRWLRISWYEFCWALF